MDKVRQLVQQAEILIIQLRMQSDRTVIRDMTIEAKDCLIKAEAFAPGSGSWLLAQMSAGQGDGERCRKWLERGARNGALPPRDAVAEHPAMADVRSEQWFQALLADLE